MSRRIVLPGLLLCLALGDLHPPVELPRVALQAISRPRMDDDYIPYAHRRKRQMARYSRRHYGRARWRLLIPKVIVLHFTGGTSYSSAWNWFVVQLSVARRAPRRLCAFHRRQERNNSQSRRDAGSLSQCDRLELHGDRRRDGPGDRSRLPLGRPTHTP